MAGALLDISTAKRQEVQARMDRKVQAANNYDLTYEGQLREQIVKAKEKKYGCDCEAPPVGRPRYVLQPTRTPYKALRPGGTEKPPWEQWGEDFRGFVDETGDQIATTAGRILCDTAAGLGILEEAQELGASFEFFLGDPQGSSGTLVSPDGQFIRNTLFGGLPFLVTQLVETCDLGPAIKSYAAAESDKLEIAGAAFGVAALVGGVPTAGISVATLGTVSDLCFSVSAAYAEIARGQWVSWQVALGLINQGREVWEMSNDSGELPEGLKEAVDYANTAEQAIEQTRAAFAKAAKTQEELRDILDAMAGVDQFVKPGSVAPQPTAVQPSPFTPNFYIFPSKTPNPLVVRPQLTETFPIEEVTTSEEAPRLTGGNPLPLVGLGFLLDLF
jgi:hypothetical protein